jgi:uncharacterized protein (DUF58 family)
VNATGQVPAPLEVLRRLEWRVRHAVENTLSGEYRSHFRGRGMEFDSVVKYEFGDDVRDIDWNVTARLGEPYRKKFVEEREVTVMLLFEDTPALRFGSGRRTKRDALLELASLLMLLGSVNRDRIGFVHATPTGSRVRPPVRGRGAILHAAATLLAQPPPDFGAGELPALIPWSFLSRSLPRHSVLIWLGDFPPHPPPPAWALLQRRYQCLGFRVEDAWERAGPGGAHVTAFDPVASRLVLLTGSSAEKAAHAEWRARRDRAWSDLFPRAGSRLTLAADADGLDALVGFFRARSERAS